MNDKPMIHVHLKTRCGCGRILKSVMEYPPQPTFRWPIWSLQPRAETPRNAVRTFDFVKGEMTEDGFVAQYIERAPVADDFMKAAEEIFALYKNSSYFDRERRAARATAARLGGDHREERTMKSPFEPNIEPPQYTDFLRFSNILLRPYVPSKGNLARGAMWRATGEYEISHPSGFCRECGGWYFIRRDEMASMSVHFGHCKRLHEELMLRCGHHVDNEKPVPPSEPFLNGAPFLWTRDGFYCRLCYQNFNGLARRVVGKI